MIDSPAGVYGRDMDIIRLPFDPDSPSLPLAKRASLSAQKGDYLLVQGIWFVVIAPGEVFKAIHLPPKVYSVEPTEKPSARPEKASKATPRPKPAPAAAKAPEEVVSVKKGPSLKVGVSLVSKDSRRKSRPAKVTRILEDVIELADGRTVKKDRLSKYAILE